MAALYGFKVVERADELLLMDVWAINPDVMGWEQATPRINTDFFAWILVREAAAAGEPMSTEEAQFALPADRALVDRWIATAEVGAARESESGLPQFELTVELTHPSYVPAAMVAGYQGETTAWAPLGRFPSMDELPRLEGGRFALLGELERPGMFAALLKQVGAHVGPTNAQAFLAGDVSSVRPATVRGPIYDAGAVRDRLGGATAMTQAAEAEQRTWRARHARRRPATLSLAGKVVGVQGTFETLSATDLRTALNDAGAKPTTKVVGPLGEVQPGIDIACCGAGSLTSGGDIIWTEGDALIALHLDNGDDDLPDFDAVSADTGKPKQHALEKIAHALPADLTTAHLEWQELPTMLRRIHGDAWGLVLSAPETLCLGTFALPEGGRLSVEGHYEVRHTTAQGLVFEERRHPVGERANLSWLLAAISGRPLVADAKRRKRIADVSRSPVVRATRDGFSVQLPNLGGGSSPGRYRYADRVVIECERYRFDVQAMSLSWVHTTEIRHQD